MFEPRQCQVCKEPLYSSNPQVLSHIQCNVARLSDQLGIVGRAAQQEAAAAAKVERKRRKEIEKIEREAAKAAKKAARAQMGRPVKMTPEKLETAVRLLSEGVTKTQIARQLEVNVKTIANALRRQAG